MLSPDEARELQLLLDGALDDADAEIIHRLRTSRGHDGVRESLLSQLDALEIVRERLNVRIDRIVRPDHT
jgi:hypothetical protein